ncbi:MAG TPA: APC family permease [Candidatus Enterococcus stercoripullorum]|nr:APC family permease [Candidatus Enterococcus stercoripullorum]
MKKQINLLEAISIGIGGMVGGGIFAVLGLAVTLAKGSTPIAFMLAGAIALMTAYSYVHLTKAFPSNGGTVRFINEGFGVNLFSGSLNNLLWISYIIMLSLYASAFGSYAPNLFKITGTSLDFHIYASAIVIFSTFINYYSIRLVGLVESYAVIIKLVILLGFVLLGVYGLFTNPNVVQLSPKYWENPIQLFAGGMVIFVAYEGFELIANAALNIVNPQKNIAKAYYISVVFVIALYIIIAIVTVGSLPFEQIAKAQDYALAQAAKPFLGHLGFVVITIAALISTFSAINASIYGGGQVNYDIAEEKELPKGFLHQFSHQPIGLLITSVATLVLVNTLQLSVISTTGSIGFLIIFGMVNLAAFRLSQQIHARKWLTGLAAIACFVATGVLIIQQYQAQPLGIYVAMLIMVACMGLEYLNLQLQKRK